MFAKKSSIALLVIVTSFVATAAGETPVAGSSAALSEPLWQFATGG
jgi:hypothetical protein